MEKEEKIKKIARYYGYDAQSRQCIEEMAELTQAINKFWRKDLKCGFEHKYLWGKTLPHSSTTFENLIEEIADVQIMLWQMAHFLDADIVQIIDEKLDQQLARMEEENVD